MKSNLGNFVAAARVLLSIGVLTLLFGSRAMGEPVTTAPEPLDLTAYRGKVVVVDFWASWCRPCRRSIPWLNELQARHSPRGLVVLGVNTDTAREDADRFMAAVPVDFKVIFDPQGQLAAHYKLPGMPTSLIFDRDGRLMNTHVGFRESEQATREREIVSLLEKGK